MDRHEKKKLRLIWHRDNFILSSARGDSKTLNFAWRTPNLRITVNVDVEVAAYHMTYLHTDIRNEGPRLPTTAA